MILTDTGPVMALIDTNEAQHEPCRLALPRFKPPMVMPWPCYVEAMYLLQRELGYPGQKALWRLRSSGQLVLHECSPAEIDRMEVLMDKYRDLPMDLADASLVAAAEALGLQQVFTLDRHFYAYRLADGTALEVFP